MAMKPAKLREKRPRGRPPGTGKLTPTVESVLCKLLARGRSRALAARKAGISGPTLCRWMAEGENPDSQYWNLRNAVLRAEDEHQERAEQALYEIAGLADDEFGQPIDGSANDGVRLAAIRLALERRYRAEWAQSSTVAQTGPDGGPVQVTGRLDVTVRPLFSDEQLAAMTPEMLAAALGKL